MSLTEAVYSTEAVEEKTRLQVDMAAMRESIRRKEIIVYLVDTKNQLVDVLTKPIANSQRLMATLQCGRVWMCIWFRDYLNSV